MNFKLIRVSFFALISLFLLQCKKGELVAKIAPDTQIFLDTINLSGNNSLLTNVELHWIGSTPNGYIKGYEISFDNVLWTYTTATDSIFQFRITDTTGKQKFTFLVRSIDDGGVKDPTPAKLVIPVKNTAPTIKFIKTNGPIDTVYSVFTVKWTAQDIDGLETLDSVFFKLNDGNWYGIPATYGLATFKPVTPKINGVSQVYVYGDIVAKLQPSLLQGLQIGGINKLYIKAKDNSRSFSIPDTSISFYVTPQKGDILVINSHSGLPCAKSNIFSSTCTDPRTPEQIIIPYLNQDSIVGTGRYDFINIYKSNRKYSPLLWDPTFSLFLSLYDQVFWISDNTVNSSTNLMPLESASGVLQKYLNNGGKLLVSTGLPSASPTSIFTNNSSIFEYSPMASVYFASTGSANLRNRDSLLIPQAAAIGYPSLLAYPFSGTLLTSLSPFYSKSGAQILYTGQITRSQSWAGPNNFIARTQVNGKTNMVFSSIELNRMIGRPNSLGTFFKKVFKEEFNW